MKATQADILGGLAGSELEAKEEAGKAFVRRKENAKLPALEARPPLHGKKKQSNVHDGGVVFQVKGIPEEQTWLNLKEAVKAKLPEGGQVWFVSSVSEGGVCVVALSPFERDVEVVSTELKVNLGGADLVIEVCYADALQQALKMLPKGIKDYHPAKDRKTACMKGIKVDVSEHGGSRCFWVIREDGGKGEDFSIKKCLDEIEKNPPYADAPAPAKGSAASPAGKKEDIAEQSPKKEGADSPANVNAEQSPKKTEDTPEVKKAESPEEKIA